MNYTFYCPLCNQFLKASEEILGKTIECPTCHKQIVVPLADPSERTPTKRINRLPQAAVLPAQRATPPALSPPIPPTKPRRRSRIMMVVVIAGGLFAAAAGLLVIRVVMGVMAVRQAQGSGNYRLCTLPYAINIDGMNYRVMAGEDTPSGNFQRLTIDNREIPVESNEIAEGGFILTRDFGKIMVKIAGRGRLGIYVTETQESELTDFVNSRSTEQRQSRDVRDAGVGGSEDPLRSRANAGRIEAKLLPAKLQLENDVIMPDSKEEMIEVIARLKDEIDTGNWGAMNDLGVLYATGKGVLKEEARALELFQEAAGRGSRKARENLRVMYESSLPGEPSRAVEFLRDAAAQGDVRAQKSLAIRYARGGHGVPMSQEKAVEWFEKAAAQGDGDAQILLGDMNIGRSAIEWYEKAARLGNTEAQFLMGQAYAKGKGVSKDRFQANVWYNLAEGSGYGSAVGFAKLDVMMSFAEQEEIGKAAAKLAAEIKMSTPTAPLAETKMAAERGDASAQEKLAATYAVGNTAPQDPAMAFEWYQKAALQGSGDAQFKLAEMYNKGAGAPKDLFRAIVWFTVAEKHGHDDTLFVISDLEEKLGTERLEKVAPEVELTMAKILKNKFERGRKVPQDEAAALEWYRKAALQGDTDAQMALGGMYRCGLGVQKDPVRSFAWFSVAEEIGCSQGFFDAGDVAEKLNETQRAEAKKLAEGLLKQIRKN